ncbi:MAG: hypothetical protein IKD07_00920, partial [Clostridia bacterium]|nr:hypothetical protein [Clostridia bacterium]
KALEKAEGYRKDVIYQTALGIRKFDDIPSLENAILTFRAIEDWRDAAKQIEACEKRIAEIETAKKNETYEKAQAERDKNNILSLKNALALFQSIADWRDAKEQAEFCEKRISVIEQDRIYLTACLYKKADTVEDLKKAVECFAKIPNWSDAQKLEAECRERITELECLLRKKAKILKIIKIVSAALCAGIVLFILIRWVIIPSAERKEYKAALALMESGQYDQAIAVFDELNGYKDSAFQIEQCRKALDYQNAVDLMETGNRKEAISLLKTLGDYSDSAEKLAQCQEAEYQAAVSLMNAKKYAQAISIFEFLGDYKDCVKKAKDCLTLQKYNN